AAAAAAAASVAMDAATGAAAAATAAGGGGGGLVRSAAEMKAAMDPLVLLQRSGGPVVAPLVETFSFLAIATSFTGFVLATADFLPDAFKPLAAVPRAGRFALVVLPPILLSTASPGMFYAALDIAGTYGVMTLYGMMPAAMAWASRYGKYDSTAAETVTVTSTAAADDSLTATPAVGCSSSSSVGSVGSMRGVWDNSGSSGGRSSGTEGCVRTVELVPGGPAMLLLTGVAAAGVIVSQWVH
ncbi:hypothetical protein Agub_g9218, partial [Astrephomene gubernaculifera]